MKALVPGTLSEAAVRAWVGDAAYERAVEYVREGAVFDARRQGTTLRARCEGQSAESYHVRAELPGGGVARAGCSCPVGADGRCKHVGALLVTWIRRSSDFVVVDDVDAALARRSRAELIALVKQMLRQEPDLETLLVTPLPDGRARTPRTVSDGAGARMYRRQAEAVFRRNGTEWGAVVPIVTELEALRAIGEGFLAQGDAASALAVFEGLGDAVIDRYAEYERQDEDALLRHVVTECVEGLGRCIAMPAAAPTVREGALRAMFEILEGDDHLGDMGPADEVPEEILAHANAHERALVARWVRSLAPEATPWHARPHAGLLLDLEADALSDDDFLVACAALGRDRDRVERLLARGRTDEALEAARQSSTENLRAVADLLVEHGHGDIAGEVVRYRTSTVPDVPLHEWLLARARSAGDREAMMREAEALLAAAPSLDRWRALRSLVTSDAWAAWEPVRERALKSLDERAHRVAVEALLDEGDVQRALDRVRDEPTVDATGLAAAAGMKLKVAEAAERTYPREAVAIWEKHVDDLVATGRRTQYREAASVARRVCALRDALGEHAGGAAWLASLKERHGRLRALREELAAAGL